MLIHIVPFKHFNGLADIETNEIFISPDAPNYTIIDELAHLLAHDIKHGNTWKQWCHKLAGFIPPHNNVIDGLLPLGNNIGNISGIQQILTDYNLLQQYRRFSQRILGNEGHWEVLGDNKIRLYPTPKGSFPVAMLYIPFISTWRTPANRQLTMDLMLAETMIMLGNARGKLSSIPSPDGGSITLDGDDMKSKGYELRTQVLKDSLLLSDDPGASSIFRY